jgi:hypothetical protein
MFASLLRNASFTLCTLSGEPLLVMQEHFSWLSYVYVLHRYVPATNTLITLATVRGLHVAARDVYEVEMAPGLAASMRISCAGEWPARSVLTQHAPGQPGPVEAAVVERVLFSAVESYRVTLAPGADVLLYLGIAAAIDRIHHEIEEKHRRAPGPAPGVGVGVGLGVAALVAAEAAAAHRPPHHFPGHPHHHHHHPPPPAPHHHGHRERPHSPPRHHGGRAGGGHGHHGRR